MALNNLFVTIDSTLQDELADLWAECSQANWDGYGAEPVSAETLAAAERFLRALPASVPTPSLGAVPNGHVTLEWFAARLRTLSVSITADGKLFYAAIVDPERVSGATVFRGDVPQTILDLIDRVGTG